MAESLKLNESERILVEDLHDVVLPDAQRRGGKPPGNEIVNIEQLQGYTETFIRVLEATFGKQYGFHATIFQTDCNKVGASLLSIQINKQSGNKIVRQTIESEELHNSLQKCSKLFFSSANKEIGFQRVIEVINQGDDSRGHSTMLHLVRPNRCRYWLRSLALRDADRLGALIISSANAS